MKTFIIEDSRLARRELKDMLNAYGCIQICGEAENPAEALPLIQRTRPDVLFLDINMPGKNGFELLSEIDYDPKVIFITAYAEYALRAFEFSTVDYLLKPVTDARLKGAIDKLTLSISGAGTNAGHALRLDSKVFLRDGEQCCWVGLKDIHCFESVGNSTKVVWNKGCAVVNRALLKVEERLPVDAFFRANRQHIINVNEIEKIEPWFNGGYRVQLRSGLEIEVSRRHAVRFKENFSL